MIDLNALTDPRDIDVHLITDLTTSAEVYRWIITESARTHTSLSSLQCDHRSSRHDIIRCKSRLTCLRGLQVRLHERFLELRDEMHSRNEALHANNACKAARYRERFVQIAETMLDPDDYRRIKHMVLAKWPELKRDA